jgi:ABC-2 type transport system ATP-binding protein
MGVTDAGSPSRSGSDAGAVLQVTNLSKRYGRISALRDVSFTIRPGEVLGVIGPNGAGKTTLFECLGGVLPSDTGTLTRNDRPITAAERIATVFYLPDAIVPWAEQTVRWALNFTRGYWGDAAQHTRSVEDIVGRLGLESLLTSRIGALSRGQRKRALLAMGLLTPQPVLLADEPFDGLDLRQTRDVAATLRHYAATGAASAAATGPAGGRTIVLSIHQIGDAARVCDRFVLLSGGCTRGEGTPAELAAIAATRGAMLPAAVNLEEIVLALT